MLDYVDELTLDDINPVLKYWQRHPPAHEVLALVHLKPTKRQDGPSEAELIASGHLKVKRPKKNV